MTNRILQYLETDAEGALTLPSLEANGSGWSERAVHADAMVFRYKGNDFGAAMIDAHLQETECRDASGGLRHDVALTFTGHGVAKGEDGGEIVITSPSALDAIIMTLLQLRQMPATQAIFDQIERDAAARAAKRAEAAEATKQQTFDVDAEDEDDRGDDWKAGV